MVEATTLARPAAATFPLSRALVRMLLDRHRRGLPPEVMHRARLHTMDSICIALAARPALPIGRQVIAALAFGAGGGDSPVIGSDERLPPALAGFANSALAHALDYDDIHDIARLHPTTVTLPAALAVAGPVGAGIERVLAGMALGNELMCRLGTACAPTGDGPGSDWFLTQLFGYLGGCLSACIVLDLPEDDIVSAFGLAYMQLAGGKQTAFGTGSTARSIYPAFAAMGGVQAALLARAGVTGPEGALDGPAGMFNLYLGGTAPDLGLLLAEDGWSWLATEVKPWPSCRLSHPYVAAALALRERLGGPPTGRVTVAVNPSAAKLCRPLEQRRRPETLQDAKYSIPFMTAFTLAHGKVDLASLGAEAMHDPAAREMAARIDIVETLPDRPGHPPAELTVQTPEGPLTLRRDAAPVLDDEGLRAKGIDCLRQAGIGAEAGAIWDQLLALLREGPAADFLAAIPRVAASAGADRHR
ncbi:2-methylcitrate dehydratase PrpD [Humitalea rosea]|uniref:2-methylcitrate dehydratase PrpD n=1 Tax=Humitalea rosea TaxID=990373 RepID=A0A2W7IXJ1_9PROT|nr:MmgE/PrpD family protein [Humitalea rosea]PZW50905.1 2-methylcitrate dehydratase PrpD [Humitalea rosea]